MLWGGRVGSHKRFVSGDSRAVEHVPVEDDGLGFEFFEQSDKRPMRCSDFPRPIVTIRSNKNSSILYLVLDDPAVLGDDGLYYRLLGCVKTWKVYAQTLLNDLSSLVDVSDIHA